MPAFLHFRHLNNQCVSLGYNLTNPNTTYVFLYYPQHDSSQFLFFQHRGTETQSFYVNASSLRKGTMKQTSIQTFRFASGKAIAMKRISELEIIAKALKVDVLYLLTYPHIYVKKEKDHSEPIEAILQLKLTGDKREKILRLIFGDNDLAFLDE